MCLCTHHSAQLSIFVSSFCARTTHTLTVQWSSNLALISCAPDETNTDSLFTFVKAPAAAVLVPHTHTHTIRAHKHALMHTQPLNQRPSPSWGLQEEPTLHKMALAAQGYTLPAACTQAIAHIHRHTQNVSCFVRQNNTAAR